MITGAIKLLDKVFGYANRDGMDKAFEMLDKDEKRDILYSKGNMLKLLRPTIIEPLILVSASLRGKEEVDDLVSFNVQAFCAFYSRAFTYLLTIHKLDPKVALSLLSSGGIFGPNGFTQEGFDSIDMELDLEDVDFGMPYMATRGGIALPTPRGKGNKNSASTNNTTAKPSDSKDKSKGYDDSLAGGIKSSFELDEKFAAFMTEFNIEIESMLKDGTRIKINIPITVKSRVKFVEYTDMQRMVGVTSADKGLFSRFYEWVNGVISFRELAFAGEMVKEYKKASLEDKTGTISEMNERSRDAAIKLGKDGAIGYGKLYQMLILESSEASRLLKASKHNLRNEDNRTDFLNSLNSLSLTTYDLDYERFTMYLNGLSGETDLSIKQLKKAKDSKVEDMMKLFLAGKML